MLVLVQYNNYFKIKRLTVSVTNNARTMGSFLFFMICSILEIILYSTLKIALFWVISLGQNQCVHITIVSIEPILSLGQKSCSMHCQYAPESKRYWYIIMIHSISLTQPWTGSHSQCVKTQRAKMAKTPQLFSQHKERKVTAFRTSMFPY